MNATVCFQLINRSGNTDDTAQKVTESMEPGNEI